MPTVRSPVQHAVFDRDGNILAMGFFDEEETGLLQTAVDQGFCHSGAFPRPWRCGRADNQDGLVEPSRR